MPPYGSAEPLGANDLPRDYTLCVQRQAVTSAAVYDVFYECHKELVWYVVQLGGLNQEAKATMLNEMDTRAMNYAHEEVIARHGGDAVRRTLEQRF